MPGEHEKDALLMNFVTLLSDAAQDETQYATDIFWYASILRNRATHYGLSIKRNAIAPVDDWRIYDPAAPLNEWIDEPAAGQTMPLVAVAAVLDRLDDEEATEVRRLGSMTDEEADAYLSAELHGYAARLKVPVWEATHPTYGRVYFLVAPGKDLPLPGDLSGYTNDWEALQVELELYEQSLGYVGADA